jgi:protein-tyrosine phosphatase
MKILMVCLGNICRSPMAEGLMLQKIRKYGINAEVDSAGFVPYHTDDPPDPRAQKTMANHGIDISGFQSRLFTEKDFDEFDQIYVMDGYNFGDVISMARNESDRNKVDYLLNTVYPAQNKAVPDPYYGDNSTFENVYKLLDAATTTLVKSLVVLTGKTDK